MWHSMIVLVMGYYFVSQDGGLPYFHALSFIQLNDNT